MNQNPSSSLSTSGYSKYKAAVCPALAKVLKKIWGEHRMQHQFTQLTLEKLASRVNLHLKSGYIDLLLLSSVGYHLISPECSVLTTHDCGQGLPGSGHIFLRFQERAQLFLDCAFQDLSARMYLLPRTHLSPPQFCCTLKSFGEAS